MNQLAAAAVQSPSFAKQALNMVSALVIFAVILYLAYLASKLVGKRYTPGGLGKKNVQVLESISLGPNKSLLLVQAGEKTMLLGVTKERITYLSEVDRDTITLPEPPDGEPLDFAKALKLATAKRFGKSKDAPDQGKGDGDDNTS